MHLTVQFATTFGLHERSHMLFEEKIESKRINMFATKEKKSKYLYFSIYIYLFYKKGETKGAIV